MDILYFADTRFPLERANGIQTFHTCCALAKRGHRVRLIVRPDPAREPRDAFEFYGEPRIDTLTIERVPVAGPAAVRRALWLARAVRRATGARRAAVALSRDLGLASLLLRVPAGLRPPIVYESHVFAPAFGAALDQMLSTGASASRAKQARLARREARVWHGADGYVTITRTLADELTGRFGGRDALAVVPDGAALPRRPDAPPVERHDPPVVGYTGHLYPWKGVDVLLEAVARLRGVRALIVGGLAGEPDLERARARAHDLHIDERVTFTGAVPPPEVGRRLLEADVLVLPNTATHVSARYTSPLKLFEYMASGRPIVASDLPALREVLTDGDNAMLVAPGEAGQLAAAIEGLLRDPALGARLAAAAWRDVQAYSWDRRAERLEEVLRAAGAARSGAPARRGAGV